jgi:hypothetical protein
MIKKKSATVRPKVFKNTASSLKGTKVAQEQLFEVKSWQRVAINGFKALKKALKQERKGELE